MVKSNTQVPRQGFLSVISQLEKLETHQNYTILDDVIFSGEGCQEIIKLGEKMGITFDKVMACVTIGEGKKRLNEMNIDVVSLYHFDDVIDEVCQRDFIPGFPGCGRTMITKDGEYRYVPYLLPWGNPSSWASVPVDNATLFSKACIQTAIDFWEEVYPSVRFFEVPAIVYDPSVISTKLRFVDYLHQAKKNL